MAAGTYIPQKPLQVQVPMQSAVAEQIPVGVQVTPRQQVITDAVQQVQMPSQVIQTMPNQQVLVSQQIPNQVPVNVANTSQPINSSVLPFIPQIEGTQPQGNA